MLESPLPGIGGSSLSGQPQSLSGINSPLPEFQPEGHSSGSGLLAQLIAAGKCGWEGSGGYSLLIAATGDWNHGHHFPPLGYRGWQRERLARPDGESFRVE